MLSALILRVFVLNVIYAECHMHAQYADCLNADRHFANCRGAIQYVLN
jgi:hypothetical protein